MYIYLAVSDKFVRRRLLHRLELLEKSNTSVQKDPVTRDWSRVGTEALQTDDILTKTLTGSRLSDISELTSRATKS